MDRGFSLILFLLALPLAGCLDQKSRLGRGPVQPNPEPILAHDATTRISQLSEMLSHLDTSARALPGNSDEDLRKAGNDIFANLSEILPTLHGPEESGGYRQQRRIVDSSRAQLQNMPNDLAPEPVIDAGLRATYTYLSNLQRDQFYDQKQIAQSLDTLRGRLDTLDGTKGPEHRTAIAQSVQSLSQTLHQMSDTLNTRLQQQRAAGQQPQGQPRT